MKTLTLCTCLAVALTACAEGSSTEPKLSSAEAPLVTQTRAPTRAGWPVLGNGTARFIRIDLGPDTFEECRRVSPKFPFDSATTYAQDREQLAALATCLNAPGLRERTVVLVGRADSRGTDAYNEELGTKRANAIRQILVDNGIAPARIEVATEGKKGALGNTPDYSPGYDRRVDVIVKGGTHAP